VMLSLSEYESLEETAHLLRSPSECEAAASLLGFDKARQVNSKKN
jgi:PHD/YefM family antitoxin component YafN of YafNO toxin-antitoxin module